MRLNNSSRNLILCMLFAVVSVTAWADNVLTLSSSSGLPRDQVEITVSLENSDAVSGVQMDLPLPSELAYVEGSAVMNGERSDGHLMTAAVSGNVLKVVIYSLRKQPLKGNTGNLFGFRLSLGKEPAVYPLSPTIELASAMGTDLSSRVMDGSVTIVASKIQVSDQTFDFGHIALGQECTKDLTVQNIGTKALSVTGLEFTNLDYSVDVKGFTLQPGASRRVSITYAPTTRGSQEDVLTITSDAVNGKQMVKMLADPYAVNELHVIGGSGISDQEVEVALSMNNMDPINGVQCSFVLPEQLEYVNGSAILTDRKVDHRISAAVSGKKLTLVVFSSQGTALKDNDGKLITFRVKLIGTSGQYVLHPENVVLGMTGGQNVVSATLDGTICIESPRLQTAETLMLVPSSLLEGAKGECLLHNPSTLPLVVSSVSFLNEGFSVDEELPLTISALTEKTLTVRYTNNKAGDFATTMNLYTNDPDQRVCKVALSGSLYEPNTIAVKQLPTENNTLTFSVSMDNYSTITGLQINIKLEGVGSSDVRIEKSIRLENFTTTLKQVDGMWRLLVHSFQQGASIEGHEGEIFRILCPRASNIEVSARLTLDEIVLSGTDMNNWLTPGSELICEIGVPSPGDVNGDGQVDELDLAALTNLLTKKVATSELNVEAADMNNDGLINALDLTFLTNKILNK